MTPEQKFYQWFNNRAKNSLRHVCRIENIVGAGMPDINVCSGGCEIWVELKIVEGGKTLLRPEQYAWGHKRASCGGKVFVLARHDSKMIFAYQFPHVTVEPYQRWLRITGTDPRVFQENEGDRLINFLFM